MPVIRTVSMKKSKGKRELAISGPNIKYKKSKKKLR